MLQVGSKCSSSKASKASSAGAVEFPTPIVLHLGPDEARDPHARGAMLAACQRGARAMAHYRTCV